MQVQRNFFIFAFFFVSFLIWKEWSNQFSLINQKNSVENTNFHISSNYLKKHQIIIRSDVLNLVINMNGGDIEEATLLKYKEHLNSSQSFKLLATEPDFIYQAQSGLIGVDGLDDLKNNIRPLYFAKKNFFILDESQKEICVPITFVAKNGVVYIKKFILKKGSYDVQVQYVIHNSTNKDLMLRMFGQLKQTIDLPKKRDFYSSNFALQTFRGAAYSNINEKYEKYKFNKISQENNVYISAKNVWIAMLQQYFATAWVPENLGVNIIYTSNIENGIAIIGYKSPILNVLSHSDLIIKSKLWIGPEIQKEMAIVAPNLDLTVDYGWLWFLSQPLFKLLSFLNRIIGNWGFSIILITFIVRALTYPLTKMQYVSMAKMRILQPKIDEIKSKFANDNKRMSQEMMLLYTKEKINPLGGCLPVLIQMPIFLSLYYMLMGSVELRHAPFILWIHDLSGPDPYYILPVIMGFTMFFIQKMSSNSIMDPMQKKIMNFMPVIFTGFFLWFPSGLVLYYIVSNLVSIVQQKFVIFQLDKNK